MTNDLSADALDALEHIRFTDAAEAQAHLWWVAQQKMLNIRRSGRPITITPTPQEHETNLKEGGPNASR